MPLPTSSEAFEKFAEIISEFSFGLTYTEFSFGGKAYSYIGVEMPLLLVGYLSGAPSVGVRDADGNVVQIAKDDMPGFLAAMFEATDPQRTEFAAKYKQWLMAGDNVKDIDAKAGWTRRSLALQAFEDKAEKDKRKPKK